MALNRSLAESLAADPFIGKYVDQCLSPPSPFRGTGQIRLIILGQDPTVKREASRGAIKTVLNLDRPGALRHYLEKVCHALGLSLDKDIYSTNYVNVFFKVPPASIKAPDILGIAKEYCFPPLRDELKAFPEIPILTLGQPLLRQIAGSRASAMVRDYWGYNASWRQGKTGPFTHLPAGGNDLQRNVFPFPHQPSSNKLFYSRRMAGYLQYMKAKCFD
mgnify:CR=1 FL=1